MLSSGPIMKEGKHGMAVLGMGGLFFRAHDPDALNAWYRTHLGVGAGCVSDPDAQPDEWTWRTLGGPIILPRTRRS